MPELERRAPLLYSDPPVSQPIGTKDPIWVTASDPKGRWTAFCQARKDTNGDGQIGVMIGIHGDAYGDTAEPYLQVGNRPDEPFDELVTQDASGRHIVITQQGRLILIDTETNTRTDLSARGADAAGDPSPLASHGAASLDDTGQWVVFRKLRKPASLGLLDIAHGTETAIDAGQGTLLGAWLDGPWALMKVRTGGSANHVTTTYSKRRCRGPAASYSVYSTGGTEVREIRARPIAGGTVNAISGFIAVLGKKILRRDEDGSIRLEDESGRSSALSDAACQGHVLGLHDESERALIACKDGSVAVHKDGGRDPVSGVTAPGVTDDRYRRIEGSLVRILTDTVVDIDAGKARTFSFERITHSDGIVALHNRRILVRRKTELYLTDFDSEQEVALPGAIEPYPTVIANGRVVYVAPLVVDMEAAAVLGVTGRGVEVFGVLATGHILASPERPGAYVISAFPPGPVQWIWPPGP